MLDSLKSRIISGGLWAFFGKVFISLSSILTNAILARLLEPKDLGIYFAIFNVMIFLSTFANLGLNQAVIKYIAQYLNRSNIEVLIKIIKIVFQIMIIGLATLSIIFLLWNKVLVDIYNKTSVLSHFSICICIWTIVYVIQQITAEIFRGFHDIKNSSNFGGVLSGILFLILLFIYYILKAITLKNVLTINIVSIVISTAVGLIILKNKLSKYKRTFSNSDKYNFEINIKAVLKVSFPLMVTGVTWFLLTQSDIWLLNIFRSSEEVAIYGAAVKLSAMITMPLFIVQMFVTPIIVDLYTKKDMHSLEKVLRITSSIAFIPSLIGFIIFIILGQKILSWVFGPYYINSYYVLIILSLNQLLDVYFGSTSLLLSMTGHEKLMMNITIIVSIFTVLLSAFFVNKWGVLGISISMTICLLIMNLIILITNYRKMNIFTHAELRLNKLVSNLKFILKK